MKKLTISIFFFVALFILSSPLSALSSESDKVGEQDYRGWGFLVSKLLQQGHSKSQLKKIFLSKEMPRFGGIMYNVPPRESARMYKHFYKSSLINKTKKYLRTHDKYFTKAEERYNFPKEVIGSIILIETNFGSYTGKHRIIHRLARLANAASPKNVQTNYKRLKKTKKDITFQKVKDRGDYLFDLFFPEIQATIDIATKKGLNVFSIRGSSAGAFGIPQFLPTSFKKYAVDGNRDGKISLFQHPDAIVSVGNFLSSHINHQPATPENMRKAVWHYNRSEPYVDAVLGVAKKLGMRN